MGCWHVVEGKHAEAKLKQEVGAEGYNGPEWKLQECVSGLDVDLRFVREDAAAERQG